MLLLTFWETSVLLRLLYYEDLQKIKRGLRMRIGDLFMIGDDVVTSALLRFFPVGCRRAGHGR